MTENKCYDKFYYVGDLIRVKEGPNLFNIKFSHLKIAFIFFLLGVNFLSLKLAGQETYQKALQHEVVVTLRLIYVSVLDEKGRPALNLSKDDFLLFEDGRLKEISAFETHFLKYGAEREGAKIKKEIKEIKEAPPPLLAKMNRKFFILIDFFRNDLTGLNKLKAAAIHFIKNQIYPNDEVALLSYSRDKGLNIHLYLTKNHEKVIDLIKGIRESFEGLKIAEETGGEKENFVLDVLISSDYKAQDEILWEKQRSRQFILQMGELAKGIRYLPGPKALIIFSGGIPNRLLYDQWKANSEELAELNIKEIDSGLLYYYYDLCKEFASSGCRVFAINSLGLRVFDREKESERGDDALKMISELSGGKYFNNPEYYDRIAKEIEELTANYYVLGYYTDEKWDGQYHQIKVKVKKKGYQVFAQSGFFNPKPFTQYSPFERNLHLIEIALSEKPHFQELTEFHLLALHFSDKKEMNLVLLSEMPVDWIKEAIKGKAELVTFILDEGKKIISTERSEINFSELPQKKTINYTLLSLPPGSYEFRQVIRDLQTGKSARAISSIALPEPLNSGIRIYSPLILLPEEALYLKSHKEAQRYGIISLNRIYPFLTLPLSPVIQKINQGTPKIFLVIRQLIKNISDPEIELSCNLLQLSEMERIPLSYSLVATETDDEGRETFLLEVSLPPLQPGSYSLEIQAKEVKTGSFSTAKCNFQIK